MINFHIHSKWINAQLHALSWNQNNIQPQQKNNIHTSKFYLTQNTHVEHMIGVRKRLTFKLLSCENLGASFWDYALLYACVVWNSTKKKLHDATPDQLFHGQSGDLSHLRFPFGTNIKFRFDLFWFPLQTEIRLGIYLGPSVNDGDAFTYFVYDIKSDFIYCDCIIWKDDEPQSYDSRPRDKSKMNFYNQRWISIILSNRMKLMHSITFPTMNGFQLIQWRWISSLILHVRILSRTLVFLLTAVVGSSRSQPLKERMMVSPWL